ncbi:hypothetical protein ABZP36_033105 [Zizania latifolia]
MESNATFIDLLNSQSPNDVEEIYQQQQQYSQLHHDVGSQHKHHLSAGSASNQRSTKCPRSVPVPIAGGPYAAGEDKEPEGDDEDEQNFDVEKGPSLLAWTEDDNMRLAAKAKAKGKSKVPSGNLSREDIELYHESQTVRAASTEKMAEVQLQVAKDQREAALAKERIELAKNERQIIDKYTTLLMADTTHYSISQREEHELALKYFRSILPNRNN